MPHKIDDLRSHLFDALTALKDKDQPLDLDRARAIAEVAKVIVDSAKVEVEFLKVTGSSTGTGFLPHSDLSRQLDSQVAPGIAAAPVVKSLPGADCCVLCGIKLTTPYLIERGLCGSCADRPEAQTVKRLRKRA